MVQWIGFHGKIYRKLYVFSTIKVIGVSRVNVPIIQFYEILMKADDSITPILYECLIFDEI